MMHIGDRKTLKTACGKSVKRRWWMEREIQEIRSVGFGAHSPFFSSRTIKARPEDISCPACRRTM